MCQNFKNVGFRSPNQKQIFVLGDTQGATTTTPRGVCGSPVKVFLVGTLQAISVIILNFRSGTACHMRFTDIAILASIY